MDGSGVVCMYSFFFQFLKKLPLFGFFCEKTTHTQHSRTLAHSQTVTMRGTGSRVAMAKKRCFAADSEEDTAIGGEACSQKEAWVKPQAVKKVPRTEGGTGGAAVRSAFVKLQPSALPAIASAVAPVAAPVAAPVPMVCFQVFEYEKGACDMGSMLPRTVPVVRLKDLDLGLLVGADVACGLWKVLADFLPRCPPAHVYIGHRWGGKIVCKVQTMIPGLCPVLPQVLALCRQALVAVCATAKQRTVSDRCLLQDDTRQLGSLVAMARREFKGTESSFFIQSLVTIDIEGSQMSKEEWAAAEKDGE